MSQKDTVKQMTEAVSATEVVVAEMRREIAYQQLREKCAAFEALFDTVDSSDVELVTAALVKGRRVGLDEESFVLRWIVGNEQVRLENHGRGHWQPVSTRGGGGGAEESTESQRSASRLFETSGLPSDQLWCLGNEGQFDACPPPPPCCTLRSRLGHADQSPP